MSYVKKLKFLANLISFFLAALTGLGLANGKPNATKLAITGDETLTRLEIQVSEETGFSATVQPSPYRVIIRIPGFKTSLDSSVTKSAGDLVAGLQQTIAADGSAQIALETTGAVLIASSELIPAQGKKLARIAIDLMAIDDDIFAAAYAKDQMAFDSERLEAMASAEQVASVSPPLAEPVKKIVKPVLKPEKKPAAVPVAVKIKRADGKRVVVIDPGHGGIDPGAVSKAKTLEKDVVLAFAKALKATLDARGIHHVELTREGDTFMSLVERVRAARAKGADLFISLHADTFRGKTVTGTSIYTLSDTATDDEAEALAKKENGSDVVGGVAFRQDSEDVTSILVELAQRESKNHAVTFAQKALAGLKPVTPMAGTPLRAARFLVLRAPEIPSVLIELGFLSNAEDEKRLKSEDWRKSATAGMADAIDQYFASNAVAQR